MHTYDKYPRGGWHYVVAKDYDGEAKFLHSMQIEKKYFSKSGNYFCYDLKGRGILETLSVSVSSIPELRFDEGRLSGYIGINAKTLTSEAIEIMKVITGVDFLANDYVGNFRKKSVSARWKIGYLQGETITKSQYETFRLLTDLPVLTCRPWR